MFRRKKNGLSSHMLYRVPSHLQSEDYFVLHFQVYLALIPDFQSVAPLPLNNLIVLILEGK